MRLISQDGLIDVNYDNGSIVIGFISDGSGAVISYYDHSHRDKATALGKYSSKDKALKVMEMLRAEYLKHIYGSGGEMATRDLYIPPFAFIPPKVFKFPADEEVEVQE